MVVIEIHFNLSYQALDPFGVNYWQQKNEKNVTAKFWILNGSYKQTFTFFYSVRFQNPQHKTLKKKVKFFFIKKGLFVFGINFKYRCNSDSS